MVESTPRRLLAKAQFWSALEFGWSNIAAVVRPCWWLLVTWLVIAVVDYHFRAPSYVGELSTALLVTLPTFATIARRAGASPSVRSIAIAVLLFAALWGADTAIHDALRLIPYPLLRIAVELVELLPLWICVKLQLSSYRLLLTPMRSRS